MEQSAQRCRLDGPFQLDGIEDLLVAIRQADQRIGVSAAEGRLFLYELSLKSHRPDGVQSSLEQEAVFRQEGCVHVCALST